MAKADGQERVAANVHQSDIDAGREPAQTMRQLASAVRQDVAGAGARLYSIELILHGDSIYGALDFPDDVRDALNDAVRGLEKHLSRVEEKLALAVTADSGIRLTEEEAAELRWVIGDPEDHYGDPDHPLRTIKAKLVAR